MDVSRTSGMLTRAGYAAAIVWAVLEPATGSVTLSPDGSWLPVTLRLCRSCCPGKSETFACKEVSNALPAWTSTPNVPFLRVTVGSGYLASVSPVGATNSAPTRSSTGVPSRCPDSGIGSETPEVPGTARCGSRSAAEPRRAAVAASKRGLGAGWFRTTTADSCKAEVPCRVACPGGAASGGVSVARDAVRDDPAALSSSAFVSRPCDRSATGATPPAKSGVSGRTGRAASSSVRMEGGRERLDASALFGTSWRVLALGRGGLASGDAGRRVFDAWSGSANAADIRSPCPADGAKDVSARPAASSATGGIML